jgi:hypothetical protein
VAAKNRRPLLLAYSPTFVERGILRSSTILAAFATMGSRRSGVEHVGKERDAREDEYL